MKQRVKFNNFADNVRYLIQNRNHVNKHRISINFLRTEPDIEVNNDEEYVSDCRINVYEISVEDIIIVFYHTTDNVYRLDLYIVNDDCEAFKICNFHTTPHQKPQIIHFYDTQDRIKNKIDLMLNYYFELFQHERDNVEGMVPEASKIRDPRMITDYIDDFTDILDSYE